MDHQTFIRLFRVVLTDRLKELKELAYKKSIKQEVEGTPTRRCRIDHTYHIRQNIKLAEQLIARIG